jgi:HJR/Mrr/RecB family endonuclease
LLVIAVAAKLPRSLTGLSITLVVLNVVQIVLVRVDIEEIEALHVVNALAIAFVANMLAHRSRRYLASKLATS